MNINSNELKLMNQVLKFKAAAPQPSTTPEPQAPVSKPESGMNALYAQGLNNQLSFQGGANLSKLLKNKGLSTMMALGLLAAAPLTQSCSDYFEPSTTIIEHGSTTNITIIYDNSKWEAMYEKMMEIWQMMLEQQQITSAEVSQMSQYMLQMMQMMQDGQMSAEEFYAKMYEFMINHENNQKTIMDILIDNGKTQEEANQFLQELKNLVETGQLTAAEAMQKIMEELGNINTTLDGMLEKLNSFYKEFIEFRNDYYTNKEETLGMLANIYEHGTINTQVLLAMNGNMAQLTKNFQEFQGSFEEFKMNVQNNHEELIEKIANLEAGSVDYQKFEDMFKQLGLTITDAINMSKEELIAKLDEFEQTYITTEESQTQLLQKINNDVNLIVNFPGIDQSAVIEGLNKLTEAVNNGNANITEELQTIQEQLNQLKAQINEMMTKFDNQTALVNSYLESFNKQFGMALDMLTNLSGDVNELVFQQSVANGYLNNLMKQIEELKVIINDIKESTENGDSGDGSSITIEDLENLFKNYGDTVYNKYKELIKNLGIQIGDSTATIEDLVNQINIKMDNLKDYTKQLNEIIELLKGINLSAPEYADKLDRIIELLENFKCNCNCGADSGDNEGIVGDLGDLLG